MKRFFPMHLVSMVVQLISGGILAGAVASCSASLNPQKVLGCAPEWYLTTPARPDSIFAVSTIVGEDLNSTVKQAQDDALEQLAKTLRSVITATSKNTKHDNTTVTSKGGTRVDIDLNRTKPDLEIHRSHQKEKEANFSDSLYSEVRILVGQSLEGVREVKKKICPEGKKFRVYILVGISFDTEKWGKTMPIGDEDLNKIIGKSLEEVLEDLRKNTKNKPK